MFQRTDYISWDSYFMEMAKLSAKRSKDPGTQVGCCIVDDNNVVLSTGYNGFPRGISDEKHNWSRNDLGDGITKYDLVVHSELNAILNANGKSLKNTVLYTTLIPCSECAKAIIQAGIKKVIYASETANGNFKFELTKAMFEETGVLLEKFSS